MAFILDKRLLNNAIEIASWPLCKVIFKNEANYAWFLLVPCRPNITELIQLSIVDQHQLNIEINKLSKIVLAYFKSDKLNIATIGNVVPQLHIHIIGRYRQDPLWPESIWQSCYSPEYYSDLNFNEVIRELQLKFFD